MELEERDIEILKLLHESKDHCIVKADLMNRQDHIPDIISRLECLITEDFVEYDAKEEKYYLAYDGFEIFAESTTSNEVSLNSGIETYHNAVGALGGNKNFQKITLILLLFLGILGTLVLYFNPPLTNSRKLNLKETIGIEHFNQIETKIKKVVDSLTYTAISNSERESYYGFDTLLIREYTSQSGHSIKLEGSKSKDLYRISTKSAQGKTRNFIIADDWYSASHSFIAWENEDYVFLRFGCGTSCWGGKVLSLNDQAEIKAYTNYLLADSVKNIIVYPDSIEYNKIFVEHFATGRKISNILNFCEATATPLDLINCYFDDKEKTIIIEYKKSDCVEVGRKKVSISSLF